MTIQLITVLLFGSLILAMIFGLPLTFALGGIAVIFTYFLWGPQALYMLASTTFGLMSNIVLVAILLFIFMAIVLERSGVADDLYGMMYQWMGPLRGGLAIGTVLICTLIAAMTGISGAATVTGGVIALPAMLKRNYNKDIAIGCVSAGGALGILIPPSVIMILYGSMSQVSVGGLFAGGVFSGLLLSALFIIYIAIRSALQPHLCPPIPPEERLSFRQRLVSLRSVALPILLIVGVLGSIYAGLATPTEAASVGAAGAIICAAVYRKLNWSLLRGVSGDTLRLTCMVMWIMVGASAFSSVYYAVGAVDLVVSLIGGLEVSRWLVIGIMQLILVILGCFMDPVGILMIFIPIALPIIKSLGFDPLWFGVLFVMNMEMGFLTPPFGYNLFYMKAIVPEGITIGDIYRSIGPFVALQALGLVLVMIFPPIALWLPSVLIK